MIERIAPVATTIAAVGCGITAGVLLAFSVSVMPALRTQPPSSAMFAMQQMNIAIVSPVFLTVFVGSAAAATIAAITSALSGTGARMLIVAGAVLFVIGCFVVTMMVNVPLNDGLAAADPNSVDGIRTWSDYVTRWTRWNHARTAAAIAACAVLTVASRR
ncbi:anthrone oxygenase family protein [Rhodococcoides yunnanense]|uniref:anthrone oxygenase family protein n=1 Tax=Rhodococcoides yunnanense TaxID=278209 RepID=UPI000934E22D|nr:anthrone oxygenase family protein [Rhodococcus yunnanensis]